MRMTAPLTSTISSRSNVLARTIALLSSIPDSLIALFARISLATTFWLSGQTKIEGFVVDPIGGDVALGWPRISEDAVALFRDEYALPILPPELATTMAAVSEHLFPFLLLIGLATRFSALALLGMTLVIQFLVYPDAYPTHMLWATAMLFLIAKGGGRLSLDRMLFGNRKG